MRLNGGEEGTALAKSETYCVLPFIHMAISGRGHVKPCCVAQPELERSDGQPYSVARESVQEIWHSPEMQNLRAALLRGEKPSMCRRCWGEEELGIESKRQRDNKAWSHHAQRTEATETPVWFDLKLGNLCNLKCRICHPDSSSKLAREAFEMSNGFDLTDQLEAKRWAEDSDSSFWQSMDRALSVIEHFDIYGGEPFLIPRHFELLRRSVELGFSRRQSLHYNTNATIYPEKAVEEIWPHFRAVDVMFSIDGVERAFEYQRSGAKWSDVEANVRRFKRAKYLYLSVCFTLNAMNVLEYPRLFAWAEDMGIRLWVNYLHEPHYYNVQIFSDEAKRTIENHLRTQRLGRKYRTEIESILKFMWTKSGSPSSRQGMRAITANFDRYRGENFTQVFPQISELLVSEGIDTR
jgi:MoaA/NifB/PqqE/SkfB family radical SAM enzyme